MKTRVFVYFYILILVLSPFVGYISFTFLHNGPFNVLSAYTVLTFLIFLFGIFETNKKIHIPKYLWYYLAFIIYTMLSDVILAGKSINIKYIYSNYMLTAVLALIMVENTSFTKRNISFLNKLIAFVVLIAFATILLQQFYNTDFFVNLNKENVFNYLNTNLEFDQRLPSIYSWIGLLEVGLSFLPMLAILVDKSLNNNKSKKNIQLILLLIIGLFYSFFTKSRWVMLNYLIILLIPFIYYKHNIKKIVLNIIAISLVLVFSLSIADYFGAPVYSIIENRILEKSNGGLEQGSASTRIFAFYVFGQLYPEHPVFGKGDLHTFNAGTDKDYKLAAMLVGRSSQIHVGYLSLLYYYGIVGGSLFLLAMYFLMKRLYARAKLTGHWASFFGMLGFVIANFTLVDFNLFSAGLILVMVYDRYYYQQLLSLKLMQNKTLLQA